MHLWQEEPLCALLWYQKHLNAPVRAGFAGPPPTEADCKVPRGPTDVAGAQPRRNVPHAARRASSSATWR